MGSAAGKSTYNENNGQHPQGPQNPGTGRGNNPDIDEDEYDDEQPHPKQGGPQHEEAKQQPQGRNMNPSGSLNPNAQPNNRQPVNQLAPPAQNKVPHYLGGQPQKNAMNKPMNSQGQGQVSRSPLSQSGTANGQNSYDEEDDEDDESYQHTNMSRKQNILSNHLSQIKTPDMQEDLPKLPQFVKGVKSDIPYPTNTTNSKSVLLDKFEFTQNTNSTLYCLLCSNVS